MATGNLCAAPWSLPVLPEQCLGCLFFSTLRLAVSGTDTLPVSSVFTKQRRELPLLCPRPTPPQHFIPLGPRQGWNWGLAFFKAQCSFPIKILQVADDRNVTKLVKLKLSVEKGWWLGNVRAKNQGLRTACPSTSASAFLDLLLFWGRDFSAQ